MLTAIGLDANDQIFPVAYFLRDAEIENTASWTWFLREVQLDLNISDSYGWTFLTDKQKVIYLLIFLIILIRLLILFCDLYMTFQFFFLTRDFI